MTKADIIALTSGSLFAVWLIRTGRAARIVSGSPADATVQAYESTGSTGAYPTPSSPIFSTQQGKAIAERARTRLGQSTASIYPPSPRRACATFVSSVLVSLGLLDANDPSCTGLRRDITKSGAVKVGSGPAGLTPTQVGDIVFYRDSKGIIRHVEIATGSGSTIGTSSSAGQVLNRPVGSHGYPSIDVYRYGGQ